MVTQSISSLTCLPSSTKMQYLNSIDIFSEKLNYTREKIYTCGL